MKYNNFTTSGKEVVHSYIARTLMKKMLLLSILFLLCMEGFAQSDLRGVVFEEKTRDRLGNVFVRNTKSGKSVHSGKDGSFVITASIGDILILSLPGYLSDTLFVSSLRPLSIHLPVEGVRLNQVTIKGSSVFDPRREFPQVYKKAKYAGTVRGGGFALSPSRIFGKEARNARRFKKMLKRDAEEREIDRLFGPLLVKRLLPLEGVELENFLMYYRPSLDFLRRSSKEALQDYIIHSYSEFKKLPEEKRKTHPLLLPSSPADGTF